MNITARKQTVMIPNLPTEILDFILDDLVTQDLLAVCLTSKLLRRAAEPHLYKFIRWEWRANKTPPIIQLLQTLLARPELRAYVRRVHLLGYDLDEENLDPELPYEVSMASVSTEQWTGFFSIILNTDVIDGNAWKLELCNGRMDALVALLLVQIPELEQLWLGPSFTRDCRLVGMLFGSAVCKTQHLKSSPTFSNLHEVHFAVKPGEARKAFKTNTENVLPFFYLPAVRHLSTSVDDRIPFPWPARQPIAATIKKLDLTEVREPGLAKILETTPELECLAWEWYYVFGTDDSTNTPIIDLDRIMDALDHVRETLTSLKISASCSYNVIDWPELFVQGSMNRLAKFPRLKRLEAPVPVLMGFAYDKHLEDIIPSCLECLTINGDLDKQNEYAWIGDEPILEEILRWAEQWAVQAPHLRHLTLHLDELEDDGDGDGWRRELSRVCARAGVELELIQRPTDFFYRR